MKTFTTLAALADYNHFLAEHIGASIDRSDYDQPFMWSLGGDVTVIENSKDAAMFIKSSDYFDIAEDINDSWKMFVVVNNNSGGPTTFIPSDCFEEITATEGAI